ncbi:ABC transporter ATP-binding protein [Salinirarus marinus]|uniref:ABC transporter ATP-binding protein n=1 Tax=Salinirarus marinus TaxID=3068310 RepID=UPI003C6CB1C7
MLEVRNLTKNYGDLVAVDDLSFEVDEGDFVTLLGPSGCGKSTTLHSIAGLVDPTNGQILLHGDDITDTPPNERNIGMAFQHNALFPHMTAVENIEYGLKMHGYSQKDVDDRVDELLELVQMSEHGDHKPGELSGGQQQRISLARAVAYEPDLLLLDEPLTGLDRVLREEMRREIKRIQDEVGVTTLYVTHDQEEALSLSDKIVVLWNGMKQQEGSADELYESPINEFVAEFVGKSSKFTGEVVSVADRVVDTSAGEMYLDGSMSFEEGQEIALYVRPEHVEVSPSSVEGKNVFTGRARQVTNLGSYAEVIVELANGMTVLAETESFPSIQNGDDVYIQFDPEDVIAL